MKDNLNWGLFSKYRPELYGVATIMILVFHSLSVVPITGVAKMPISILNYGVDVFLLLSGMSLYFSYSKNNDYKIFIKKRCERTLAPYLILSLFYWFWKYIIAKSDILSFLYNASGLSLFLVKKEEYLTLGEAEIWYVAFIMMMYAIYPAIYDRLFNVSEKKRKINFAIMLIGAFATTILIKFYATDTFSSAEVWLTRIPVFLIGCYLGDIIKEKRKFKPLDYILFVSVIPLKAIFMLLNINNDIVNRYLGIFSAFAICFFIAVFFEALPVKPIQKMLSFFGGISLEVYITHILIRNAILYYVPDMLTSDAFTFSQKVLIYAGIVVASVIISFAFSKTFNAVLKKIKQKKAPEVR